MTALLDNTEEMNVDASKVASKESLSMISVSIRYKLHGDENWHVLDLAPHDYFDLEPFETPEVDSVPKHNHAIDYLGVDPAQIIYTQLLILDQNSSSKKNIIEQFWNRGLNRIIEVDEVRAEIANSETIVDIATSLAPKTNHILRFSRKQNRINMIYHVVLTEDKSGVEIETSIYPPL